MEQCIQRCNNLVKFRKVRNQVKISTSNLSEEILIKNISVCYGVTPTNEEYDCYYNRKYKPYSYKPKNIWETINDEQYSLLKNDNNPFIQNEQIEVFSLPKDLIKMFNQVGFSSCKNEKDFNAIFLLKKQYLQETMVRITKLFELILNNSYSITDVKLLCFSYENPKIETIAYSISDEQYLGLHIDNGQGKSLLKREDNPNRLSINLSSEPRYLLFVDKTIQGLINLIHLKNPNFDIIGLQEDKLVYTFFSLYPDFPIYRIKLYPYEAYIAPTDFIIHDGSTIDKTNPDITMVFLGYFEPANKRIHDTNSV